MHHRINLDKHVDQLIVGRIEAEGAADKIKLAIREGRFGSRLPARVTLTIAQLLAAYLKEYVTLERPRSFDNVRYQIGAISATVLELPTGAPFTSNRR